jgi:ribonuclease Z
MEIHFLGSGNAQSGRFRQNTSLLLVSKEHHLLVDCSGTPSHALARKGISTEAIGDIILTHAHVDHIYALPSFLHNLWLGTYSRGGAKLRIHANRETLSVAERLIDAFGLREKPSAVEIELVSLNDDPSSVQVQFGEWSIESFRVNHGVPTIGLQLANGSERVVFSADSMVCDAIASRINGAQLLIHDCCGLESSPGHAGARDINALIRDSGCDLVYLAHLPELSAEELQKIVSEVQMGFAGRVVLAQDGDVVRIP